MEQERELHDGKRIAFTLRMIHNQIKLIIHKSAPKFAKAPKTQLQGGIMGYLYRRQDQPVYQRDVEKEFCISRATATNTLQVMEREGFLVRRALDRDGRLKRIQLTEEACQNHRQVEDHMKMMDERMLRGMSEAEIRELCRLLDILRGNLQEMSEELESAEMFSGKAEDGETQARECQMQDKGTTKIRETECDENERDEKRESKKDYQTRKLRKEE